MAKKAVIIGVTSQDGSYLAELLLEKGYQVVGTIRRSTNYHHINIQHLLGLIKIEACDLLDSESIIQVIKKNNPDEIYNIAAQSVPADSWTHPYYTAEVTALGIVRVLEAVKHFAPDAKVYQASSREVYGNIKAESANEETLFDANNPYGIAKTYAHMMMRCYRESFNLRCCGGILFNHESPRRGLHFVTRKITAAVACIKNSVKNPPLDESGSPLVDSSGQVYLGDLEAKRDWGYAKEYVEAMWLMLQQEKPKDFVIGTNTSHAVREFAEAAFKVVGLNWQDHVKSDQKFIRPTEITELKGDYSKAKAVLGWEPQVFYEELAKIMVEADLERFKN